MKSGVVCIFHFGGHRKKTNIEIFQVDPFFPKYFFLCSKILKVSFANGVGPAAFSGRWGGPFSREGVVSINLNFKFNHRPSTYFSLDEQNLNGLFSPQQLEI